MLYHRDWAAACAAFVTLRRLEAEQGFTLLSSGCMTSSMVDQAVVLIKYDQWTQSCQQLLQSLIQNMQGPCTLLKLFLQLQSNEPASLVSHANQQCMQCFCQEAHLYGMLPCALAHHVCCVLFNGLTRNLCTILLANGPSCAFNMTSITGLVQYLLDALAGITFTLSDALSFRCFVHPHTCGFPLKLVTLS